MGPINEADLEWTLIDEGDAEMKRKQLGERAASEQLGCSLYELPAGERSWPYHYHTANEEAIYVLTGTGTLRLDDETWSLTAGDYVAFPADESGGHRVVNDSEEPLRYLAVSTMTDPDVTVYPDMNKVGVFAGSPPGGRDERSVHGYYDLDDDVDYWED
ncbi:cupin domain-containing protein [Salinadaptatus halalkaliphilus]|uniref:Cupin domain-containing protein n=1 Tax=Salinadaptatus halalkaliphilus TaxID=2419781 RepID=A0A4V3VLC0_9EURY|nr:cupin domain-containing protein [Salinadaptatus halalkaliphilus]THE65007.1 cupin domain-containing protein [Salinadaptatus halalkaliphilus]